MRKLSKMQKFVRKIKSIDFNILDGQKRSEKVVRRILLILIAYALLYLLVSVVFDKDEEIVIQEVKVEGAVVTDGDTVNGQKVDIDENGKVWYIQAEPVTPVVEQASTRIIPDSITRYIASYPGARFNQEYLNSLAKYCDDETLRVVIAISVSETSMGRNTNRKSNFYGYFYKNNRQYDPSYDEMSRVICNGISKSYMQIGRDAQVTSKYTGGDSVKTWTNNFMSAYNSMAF